MAKKKKILIIDAEPESLTTLQQTLAEAGYDIDTETDGLQGLEHARDAQPDLILMDVVLPKVSGYKVARFIKFDETHKHIPVVFVSAKTDKADRELGMEVGASAYLSKPPDPAELLETVRMQLGLSSLS